jgi:pimeloyl-ACP methyl ester carboxylesterase
VRRPAWKTKALWVTFGALSMVLVLIAGAIASMDRWLLVVLDPGPFDPAATPPAPDYTEPSAWAALPELDDGADVALAELPAIDQTRAPADVFYIHPTTWLGAQWNAPWDDPTVIEATERGGTLIQASAFNGCCAVHAPRYRQANGRAFTHPDETSERAYAVAYADVSAAFDVFLARNGERPFIIAAHSQGAMIGARLVAQRVAGTDLERRMVAAYLVGAAVSAETIGVPVCERPTQTGCVVSWNARGPEFSPNEFEFDARAEDPMAGRVCVNPITWAADEVPAAADRNAGAIFFDTDAPAIKPGFADARCEGGVLLVTHIGDAERDVMSRLLLYVMGPQNYHPIEFQLFYVDLRNNALARVQAFAGT